MIFFLVFIAISSRLFDGSPFCIFVGVASTKSSASTSSINSIAVLSLLPIDSSEIDLPASFILIISLIFIPFSFIATPFESAAATIVGSSP